MFRRPYVLMSLLLLPATGARAQAPNVDRLRDAAVMCMSQIRLEADSVNLDPDDRGPYLSSALIGALRERGVAVFRIDSTRETAQRPTVRYDVEELRMDFARAGAGRVERRAQVGLHVSATAPDGLVLLDDYCSAVGRDTLGVAAARELADPRFAETNVSYEGRSLFRRIVEPVVVAGAAVIGTYLFFNLRSKRTEGG